MDDLDHSMHIAEYDWTSFYEECEECGLLQPSLACPDNLSLSDSEDSGNSGQQEPQQSPAANSDESNAAGCSIEVQINQSGSGEDDLTTKAQEDAERQVKSDVCLNYPEGNAINSTEETNDKVTTTLQTEQLHVQTSDGESTELRKDEKESDTSSIHEPDPLSRRQTELSVNEPQSADRAVSEDVSRRAEKERWFVTVNDSPARQRVRATSAKKKRRQKKPCRNNHMCRTPGEEKSSKNNLELNSDDNNECEGGRDTKYVTQSNQNSAEESPQSIQMGVISDVLQMSLTSGKEDSLSENLEPTIDRNKHDPSSSTFTSQDIFIAKDPPRWDSVESDEFVDGAEFFSTHSYDSESYLSATESVEEPQRPLVEKQQLQRSSVLTKDSFLFRLTENENTDTDHQEGETHPTATNSESYESTDVGPTMDFPSVAQSANKMPDDTSTCDSDTHSTLLRTPSNSTGLQKHEINLSASGCSTGDQPGLPTVPGLTLTPCSAADSPETYAEAVGNTRPVYAISAFWDEMEKLTINDILQLRMGRSIPQETVTANSDDFPANHRHTAEYNLSDGALMDTSDTADSDYFTQPDESKPDCSSCEFSTSDFEEEYWQFLGASRNTTPESESKNHPGMRDSPLFAREEDESTSSEGRETPVPSGDFSRECLDSDAFISSEPAWPRWTAKSKSVHDVQALSTEDLSLQLLVGDDESSLFLSSCPSLEEKMVLKASDSQIPAPYLSNTDILLESTQISFPEVFEYFFPDDKAKRDYRCVAVYDPEDISVTPVFDYTLCTFRNESSFSSLADSHCSDEKPIPIFSCSHPTVRELTFPNPDYVFLSADCEDEDDFSPIRVVSHSFVQGDDGAASAAAPPGFHSWRSLLSIRKIRFHDKGSIWFRRSGAWVFPVETEKITIRTSDPPIKVVTEGNFSSSASSQLFRQLEVQQRILGTIQTTRREGIFSTLKQSDMCLVCIAFASWVLRSSDPKAADAWKAALLANISALSAIQYLRQYVKKRNPSQDDP